MNIAETVKKADEYMQAGNYSMALKNCMQVIEFYRKNKKRVKITEDILVAYNNAIVLMLNHSRSRNDIIAVRNLALELRKLTKKLKDASDYYAVACYFVGVTSNSLEEYDKAVKFLEDALITFELIDHKEGIMLSCRNLAEAYKNLGFQQKAELYYGRAKAIAKEIGEDLEREASLFKKWKNLPWFLR